MGSKLADKLHYCSLLEKDIPDSYCYEIYTVCLHLLVKDDLEDAIDTTRAKEVCENCSNNQYLTNKQVGL